MCSLSAFAIGPGPAADERSCHPLPETPHKVHRASRLATVVLLGAALTPSLHAAQVPGMPTDETERAWYTSFMARFTARVVPSFQIDPDLERRLSVAWDDMVRRLVEARTQRPSPLDQYPVLGFVDDRFVVMEYDPPQGKSTFVVRSPELGELPTLSSTLSGYLDGVIYPALRSIAEEEKKRIALHADYQPRLDQLAAQNPFQHGLPIKVPEMGPFKNRLVVFTGLGGRLGEADVREYESLKWRAGGKVVGVTRDHRWGVAVEMADLVQQGEVVCRYRTVRAVAAVRDTFVGEGRRGVLVRRPELGAVLEVSGCLGGCEDPAQWTRIYPAVTDEVVPLPARPDPFRMETSAEVAMPSGPF